MGAADTSGFPIEDSSFDSGKYNQQAIDRRQIRTMVEPEETSFDQQEESKSSQPQRTESNVSNEIVRSNRRNRNTTGSLHHSCYVRNEQALSMLQNGVTTNQSRVGARQDRNNLSNLAALLGDKNAFDQAFSNSMAGRPNTIGQDKGILGDKVDAMMEASRNFMIGDLEFVFDESDPIFTLEGPLNPRNYHNTPEGCHTCQEKWKKATDLKDSHCHFCGMSNCKNCMKKTRKFCARKQRRPNSTTNLNGGKKEAPPERGSICKLCDRKFIIKDMVKGKLKEITEHSGTLT